MPVSPSVESLTISQTVEYIGGTSSQQVAVVAVQTSPSLVYFEFRIPRSSFTAEVARTEAEGYAAQVESILTDPNVAGIEWSQDSNTAGYLLDMGTIFVTSNSGNSSLSFTVPWGHVYEQAVSAPIAALVKELNAAEAGSS